MLLLFFGSSATTTYQDIYEYLHKWYATRSDLAMAGGFWADEAPLSTPLPYAIDRILATDAEHQIGRSEIHEIRLIISFFAETRNQAATLAKAWRLASRDLSDAIRDATFADGSCVDRWEYVGGMRRKDPDLGPGGVTVWIEDLLFDIQVSETY